MMGVVDAWAQLMLAGFAIVETGVRASETLLAASAVIHARTPLIERAMRDPLRGDYAELGLMISEKLTAFSQAGLALADTWRLMHGDAMEYWRHVGDLATRAAVPTVAELTLLAERTAGYGLATIGQIAGAGGLALAPIHARATANARRLRRQGQQRAR